jgi:hypothetical protein
MGFTVAENGAGLTPLRRLTSVHKIWILHSHPFSINDEQRNLRGDSFLIRQSRMLCVG